ncbi:hypothetical protein H8K32_18955 [Undibacterium jejuense]|uniref:EpsG family protein n=1 Tax=Undibacterium jejuense TaxID=1344949 RepID=A0A923HGN9_9BURK|nr:hypothetical protein [Undibacterium jejuense]MBC3864187.1 hypothetical protein [Undibacterium jejuense]
MPVSGDHVTTKNFGSRKRSRGLSFSIKMLLFGIFFVLFFLAPQLPDYETYRKIYESGGGHLAAFGRDLGFVVLIQLASQLLSYDEFRFAVLLFIEILIFDSLSRLQKFHQYRISPHIVTVLVPIILLKFGAQIREGLALVLWLRVLLCAKVHPRALHFLVMALLSVLIHMGTAPLWLLLFAAFYLQKFKNISILISSIVYAAFIYEVSNVSRLDVDAFSGLNTEIVVPDISQIIYWTIFPLIMVHTIFCKKLDLRGNQRFSLPIRGFSVVLKSAMIGLLLGLCLQIANNGFSFLQKGIFADLLRVESLILMLFCIYLVLIGKTRYAIYLSFFLILDTVRTLMAA